MNTVRFHVYGLEGPLLHMGRQEALHLLEYAKHPCYVLELFADNVVADNYFMNHETGKYELRPVTER